MTLYLVAFYCPSYLNGTAKEQKLFSKRGLASIRVADNGKGAPFLNF
jgi:hypothetical protein